jgi:hypothetical protein
MPAESDQLKALTFVATRRQAPPVR